MFPSAAPPIRLLPSFKRYSPLFLNFRHLRTAALRNTMSHLPNAYSGPQKVPSCTYKDHINVLAEQVPIAVIGGTGLQQLAGFTPAATLDIMTPWGKTSSPISILHHPSPTTGKPIAIAFLSRHGLHHELAPHEVPARANIAALRSIGVRTIIAFSAVGSLREEIKPRDFVVPDQVIDRTKGVRPFTYFEGGLVGHVMFADPFDNLLGKVVRTCGHSLEGEGVRLHDKGTIVCMGKSSSYTPGLDHANDTAQRDRNSARAPKATCIAVGAEASSTCPCCLKPSLLVKQKSDIR